MSTRLQDIWRNEDHWPDILIPDYMLSKKDSFSETYSIFVADGMAEVRSNAARFEDARTVRNALLKAGVGKGDVVAVQLVASPVTASIYHACLDVGAVVLPIVTIYGEEEVSFILKQSKAKLLFCPDSIRSSDYLARIGRYRLIDSLREIIVVGRSTVGESISWEEFIGSSLEYDFADSVQAADRYPDNLCLLVYTSGTTSRPKGVMHTHNTLMAEWKRKSFAINGPNLCCFPMGHYTGFSFLMRPLITGTTSIFMDRWDPLIAARLIEKYRVTDCGGTPYFLITLLEAANSNGVDISSLENFPMGGTGITCEHIRMAEKAGFFAGRVYGSTEHPTVTYSWPHMAFENVSGTDGQIEEANEVRIVDQDLNDVAVGQEGEVLTRGPELFVGYLDSSLNQEAFVGDGWFRTGDVGKVDMDNNLTITGRIKDIIIRGGENISALEVEGYINDIEGVAEVAVIGVPDSLLGEVVIGFIKAKDGYEIDASGIIERLIHKRITRQKIPTKVVLVKDFPRTPSGKIKKYELRSNYISDL